ncbi:hypothetical protein K505DRAFT_144152 [Melanomma pulvis-pyrius CBS 109.77]|uniref:Uncharacterized protein n=1 Tax=Melanomma pulvis-pyrius CBS 109.77 TaxID=1314802 RepID=A0A6A6WRF0_9PLEO|nr:hypothetical protein K505DRAFT_144152 [Melanomma pulvis-pyrius CBS 109.77]
MRTRVVRCPPPALQPSSLPAFLPPAACRLPPFPARRYVGSSVSARRPPSAVRLILSFAALHGIASRSSGAPPRDPPALWAPWLIARGWRTRAGFPKSGLGDRLRGRVRRRAGPALADVGGVVGVGLGGRAALLL